MGSSYDDALDKLAALLRRKPLTPRQIAEAMGCCRPTAYQRLQALIDRGENVYQLRVKGTKSTGPTPFSFGVR